MKKLILSGLFGIISMAVFSQDAASVLKKMDDAMYAAKDQTVNIKMTVIDKKGTESVREGITYQKGSTMRLFRFLTPASQKGIAVLSLPNDVMYLYMPAYQKERRIASHIKNQGFAGTDFSYDDMESRNYSEKYDAKSVKTEGTNYVLELVPKATNKTEYGKLVVTLGKDNNYPKTVKYFDKAGTQVKELNNTKIEKKGNYWTATEFEMKDLKKGTKTKMLFTNVKFDSGLADDEFTVRKLVQ